MQRGNPKTADKVATNLLQDPEAKRIFAFHVVTYERDDERVALMTTKEGLVWRVQFGDDELKPLCPVRRRRAEAFGESAIGSIQLGKRDRL